MYIEFQAIKGKRFKNLGSFVHNGPTCVYELNGGDKKAFFDSLSDGEWFYVKTNTGIRLRVDSVKKMEGSNGYMVFKAVADYTKQNIFDVNVEGIISFSV